MPKRPKTSGLQPNAANSRKRPRGDGALEKLWSRIEAEAGRISENLEPRPVEFPPELQAAWLEEAKDALTLVEHPTKGQGFIAARDLPAGTTLVVTRPLVAYYNYLNEGIDDDQDGDGGESSNEEGHSERGSEDGISNDDDDEEGNDEDDDDDPFLLDEVDASLVTKLAKGLIDAQASKPGRNGSPSLHDRALEIWPRKVRFIELFFFVLETIALDWLY